MTDLTDIKTRLPTRVGLSSHAVFHLWNAALKDDETLLNEAIASVHEQMISLDQARAELVMSLIIRRHRDSKKAFKALLTAIRTQSWAPTETRKKRTAESARDAMSNWPDEETDEPLLADHRNFYKVEKWTKDGTRVERMLYAGNNLDKARDIFTAAIKHRPRIRLTIRQRTCVLDEWPREKAPK